MARIGSKVDEVKVYGVNACEAIFKLRREAIIRVYVTDERKKDFGHLLKWCAQNKKAYHLVTRENLEKISGGKHHEGICLLTKRRRKRSFEGLLDDLKKLEGDHCLLYLEGVKNPHNLGAIVRSCAHFGITTILAEDKQLPELSPSSIRVAQGGDELVDVIGLRNPKDQLQKLQKLGFRILAAAGTGKGDLFHTTLPERAVYMFGNEVSGLRPDTLAWADQVVRIPGSGKMESLNVSCASAIFLAEHSRQHARGAHEKPHKSGHRD